MRAVITVIYENTGTSVGPPPSLGVVEGANLANFLDALQLYLMGIQLELAGRKILSHDVTLLPEK